MRSLVVLIGATVAVVLLGLLLAPLFTTPHYRDDGVDLDGGAGTRTSTTGRLHRSLFDRPGLDPTRKPPHTRIPARTATGAANKVDGVEGAPAPKINNPALDGLELGEIEPAALETMGVPKGRTGVVIRKIEPWSSAAEAALHPGDVITRVQRDNISNVDGLRRAFGDRDHTTIEIFREGRPFYIVIHKPFKPSGPK